MTKTHTQQLLRTIRRQCPDIEFVDSNFTASGVEAVISYGGQLYKIEITSPNSSGTRAREQPRMLPEFERIE